ncbi:hypothetical protein C5167_011372 [Papaver somniferum]|uniref:Nucleotide-diphospho-sugar transferase domain-containing protein n=1 Tax=Papaver somniferum TaxID=3469 RepID=A0A4Y7K6V5_PAPSO|nr:hypothetical protein C5167_011372 [Papaver somniferum]
MASSSFLYKIQQQTQQTNETPVSPKSSSNAQPRSITSFFTPTGLFILLTLILTFGVFFNPWMNDTLMPSGLFSRGPSVSKWKDYTLSEAVNFVGGGRNRSGTGTVIVCAVSSPYLPFLSNWLISISRFKHQEKVLVIAEDYKTLFLVNQRWPGHAVLIPPAPENQSAHKFGSQIKPLDHSNALPPPGKKGRTYICSCMIFLRPTPGAKLVMKKWIEEHQDQPWSKKAKANDQPGFNWALNKTAGQVDLYLLPQAAFPSGGLYFKNKTWVEDTKGKHAIIHNNYIVGFEKKIQCFRDFGLWLVDEHSNESPLGKL